MIHCAKKIVLKFELLTEYDILIDSVIHLRNLKDIGAIIDFLKVPAINKQFATPLCKVGKVF